MEIGSGVTAQETKDQFLQLLVTQLQNQDPLDPVKQEDFLSQLAQFSSLEGIENLNTTIEQQVAIQEKGLRFQELTQAATLVGTQVEYQAVDADGKPETRSGFVDGVHQINGRIELSIGDDQIGWESLTSLSGSVPSETPVAPAASDVALRSGQPAEAYVPLNGRALWPP